MRNANKDLPATIIATDTTKQWHMDSQPKLVCPGKKFKRNMNASEKVFYGGNKQFFGKFAVGLSTSRSLLVGTFIMHCAVTDEKDAWLLTKTKSWLTGLIVRCQLSINSMDASGMVVLAWKLPMTGQRAGIVKQWLSKTKSES